MPATMVRKMKAPVLDACNLAADGLPRSLGQQQHQRKSQLAQPNKTRNANCGITQRGEVRRPGFFLGVGFLPAGKLCRQHCGEIFGLEI